MIKKFAPILSILIFLLGMIVLLPEKTYAAASVSCTVEANVNNVTGEVTIEGWVRSTDPSGVFPVHLSISIGDSVVNPSQQDIQDGSTVVNLSYTRTFANGNYTAYISGWGSWPSGEYDECSSSRGFTVNVVPACSITDFSADDLDLNTNPATTNLRFTLNGSHPWSISLLRGITLPIPSSGVDSSKTLSTGSLTTTHTYHLTCESASRYVTVTVPPPLVGPPDFSIVGSCWNWPSPKTSVDSTAYVTGDTYKLQKKLHTAITYQDLTGFITSSALHLYTDSPTAGSIYDYRVIEKDPAGNTKISANVVTLSIDQVTCGVDTDPPPPPPPINVCNENAAVTVPDLGNLIPGLTYSIPIVIKNTGDTIWWEGSTVNWYRFSRKSGTLDTVPTNRPAPADPGETITKSFSITVPTVAGSYVARMQMLHVSDGAGGSPYKKLDGSTCPAPLVSTYFGDIGLITVDVANSAGPDLTAYYPTTNPTTVVAGVPVIPSSIIYNVGGATTGNTFPNYLVVKTGLDGSGSTTTELVSSDMAILGSGINATATFAPITFDFPITYSMKVCADYSSGIGGGRIDEGLNEGNNCSGWTNVVVAPGANLQAGPITSGTVTTGVPVNLTSLISNVETANIVGTFSNRLQISLNSSGTGAVSDPLVPMTDLNFGTSKIATFPHTFSSPGTYYLQVCADSAGVITETNESDNCSSNNTWVSVVVSNPIIPGVCGNAARSYPESVSSYSVPPDMFCFSGTASPANPAFPAVASPPVTWTCLGSSHDLDVPCQASRTAGTYNLTVNASPTWAGRIISGDSQINCGATCSASYAINAVVNLTAIPTSSYWKFQSWSGACSGTSPTCSVTMNAAKSATASFIPRAFNYFEF